MLIKILLISIFTILSSCGSGSSSSPTGSDENNPIPETITLNKFNENCETDYSHSFKTNYYIHSDFIITSSNPTVDSKGAKSTTQSSSLTTTLSKKLLTSCLALDKVFKLTR